MELEIIGQTMDTITIRAGFATLILYISDQAEQTSRSFDCDGRDIDPGNEYIWEWQRLATDEEGLRWQVIYQFTAAKDEEPLPEELPWHDTDKIVQIELRD